MKNATNLILSVIAASLILVTGCYDNVTEYQAVPGYDGLVAQGWACFEAGDYNAAMENFQDAIDVDVTRPEAFLGAGWTSLLVADYWVIGDQYDYMAVQQDGGTWPVEVYTESKSQNLDWSAFQCIDPVLTADDILVINSFGTTDSLVVGGVVVFAPTPDKPAMDNYEIGEWLYDQYSNAAFKYTFEIDDPNVNVIFNLANGFTLGDCKVDSIVNGASSSTVYINVPYVRVAVGSDDYRTWCMNQNVMTYEYGTYNAAGGSTGIANDAVAAYAILQNARGINGSLIEGMAALIGLADEAEYSFSHYAGLSSVKLKGMAAAMAYANTEFRFAFYICRSEGYAMDIEITDPDFVVELMQQIEMMLL